MKIIGLVEQGQGTNKVFQSCCPSKLKLLVELEPGEPTQNIHRVIWNDPSCGSTILTVGGVAYADPLTNNFVLTTGVQMEVEIDICPCQGIGTIDVYDLEIHTQSPNATYNYYFEFEGVDITTYDFVDKTSAYFFDCLNDCGRIQTLFNITNPSPLEVDILLNPSTACGFTFWYNLNDGNGFIETTTLTFNILGNSTAQVGISNDGCLVTSECDFVLDVRVCGGLVIETLPITHEQVECGDCGIHCDSIEITSIAQDVQILANSNSIDPALWVAASIDPDISYYVGLPPYFPGVFRIINTLPAAATAVIATSADWNSVIPGYPGVLPNNVQVTHKITFRNITTNFVISVYSQQSQFPTSFALGVSNAYSTFTFTETIAALANDNIYKIDIQFPAGAAAGTGVEIDSIEMFYAAQVPILTPTNLDCSNLDAYNETAIGDRKYAVFKFFYEKGFKPGTQLYFNPFLFSANACDTSSLPNGVNQIPAAGFQGTVNAVPSNMIATVYNNINNQVTGNIRNYDVFIFIDNEYEFSIQFSFFLLQDVNNWMGYSAGDNINALLKNSTNNPAILDNIGGNSVYNFLKRFCAYLKIIDPSIVVGQFPNGSPVFYECSTLKSVYFNARFWNLGLNNNPSEMQNPTWLLERNSVAYNDISTINPTDITFTLDYGVSIDTAVVYVFDASSNDNNITFLQNYNTVQAIVFNTIPTSGTTIGGVVQSPTQEFTNIGGNTYELKFRVGTSLNPTGDYYIGIVAYSNTDKMINSFLKKVDLRTTPDVGDVCCPLTITDEFIPYTNTNITFPPMGFSPTIQERIRNRMIVNPGAFQTCLENYGFDPLTDNWLNYLKQIRLKIYKKTQDNVAFLGLTNTFYMIRDFLTTRNNLGGWSNPEPYYFNVTETGTQLELNSYQRVAFDDSPFDPSRVYVSTLTEPFNRTLWNQVAAATLISNNNITWSWADQDVFYEYEFLLDLQPIFNSNQGVTWVTLYNVSVIHASDYETNPSPFGNILNPLEVYGVNNSGSTLLTTPVICNNSYDHLLVKVSTNDASNGYLLAMFNDINGSQFTLKEYESFPNTYLPALMQSPLYDVDTSFVAGEAFFKVDLQGLPAGTYKICGIRTLD